MKILILCTGNSCRSQMAEGFFKYFNINLEVYSAGTNPASKVHPRAVQVMQEVGIDIHNNHPKIVNEFLNQDFEYVITVCNNAKENCPAFIGNVHQRLHIGFDDPAEAIGTDEEILSEFRRIRDEVNIDLKKIYTNQITIAYGKKQ